jgi:hypothetical protein
MRQAAITQLNVDQVDLRRKALTVVEKGGYTHTYQISREGAQAIEDYLTHERALDAARWQSPALFLAAATVLQGTGRLMVGVVNTIWNAVCRVAQVEGRPPAHSRSSPFRALCERIATTFARQGTRSGSFGNTPRGPAAGLFPAVPAAGDSGAPPPAPETRVSEHGCCLAGATPGGRHGLRYALWCRGAPALVLPRSSLPQDFFIGSITTYTASRISLQRS